MFKKKKTNEEALNLKTQFSYYFVQNLDDFNLLSCLQTTFMKKIPCLVIELPNPSFFFIQHINWRRKNQ